MNFYGLWPVEKTPNICPLQETTFRLVIVNIGRFYTRDALFVWDELGDTFFLRLLNSSSIKTGTTRIMRLDGTFQFSASSKTH